MSVINRAFSKTSGLEGKRTADPIVTKTFSGLIIMKSIRLHVQRTERKKSAVSARCGLSNICSGVPSS